MVVAKAEDLPQNADAIRKVLRAAAAGYKFAAENPAEAAELFLKEVCGSASSRPPLSSFLFRALQLSLVDPRPVTRGRSPWMPPWSRNRCRMSPSTS